MTDALVEMVHTSVLHGPGPVQVSIIVCGPGRVRA